MCTPLCYFHFEHIPGLPLGLLPFIFNSSIILGISFFSIPPDMAISSESWLSTYLLSSFLYRYSSPVSSCYFVFERWYIHFTPWTLLQSFIYEVSVQYVIVVLNSFSTSFVYSDIIWSNIKSLSLISNLLSIFLLNIVLLFFSHNSRINIVCLARDWWGIERLLE